MSADRRAVFPADEAIAALAATPTADDRDDADLDAHPTSTAAVLTRSLATIPDPTAPHPASRPARAAAAAVAVLFSSVLLTLSPGPP